MTDPDEQVDPRLGALVGRFLDTAHRIEPHRLVDLVADIGSELGATSLKVWLADHEQRYLVHLSSEAPEVERDELAIDGTSAGRCFVTSELVERADQSPAHVWVPLLDGVDRIGVLEIEAPTFGPVERTSFRHLATLATAELVTRGQYTDAFTVVRRRRHMDLAAELQWQLLPPASFTVADVSVAGLLEPAYDVGGDAFDYAHGPGHLDLAVFDAVGHDLGSAVICNLALGTYRNSRRHGADLRTAAKAMDATMRAQLAPGSFATGHLGSLDTTTGTYRWLNAGHPLPLLVRDGHVRHLTCRPRPPLGLGHLKPDLTWEVAEEHLQPGDAVLLYTDGVTEARRPGGTDFGEERLMAFLQTAFATHLAPHETLRRLSHAIVDFHDGVLRDDATTLLLVWQPDSR